MRNFRDPASAKQIAVFHKYAAPVTRWRNALNLQRWTEECRSRWELEQVGQATRKAPIDYAELGVL